MAKRRKEKRIFKYDCSLTGETYKLTEKAEHPDDLLSVQAWYEMNPEQDDRPEDIIKRLGFAAEHAAKKLEEAAKAEAEAQTEKSTSEEKNSTVK